MRDRLVEGVGAYFKSPQWRDFMTNHLVRKTGEEVYHVHIYVDTSVHPDSMNIVLDRYFTCIGRPYDRDPHPQSARPGIACIHGIHSAGCPHWEMIFRFNPDSILEAMPTDVPEAEHGHNLLSWDRACMNSFMADIPLKVVGPREDAVIRDYFRSRHWKQTLVHVLDDNVTHVHPNLEISFDPKILEIYATRALREIGWSVEKVVPCIFDIQNLTRNKNLDPDDPVRQYKYMGKINYILGHPQKMFDFAWLYNPDVVIRPAVRAWAHNTPGFDVWYMTNYEQFVGQSPYVKLEEDEIDRIAESFRDNPFVGV